MATKSRTARQTDANQLSLFSEATDSALVDNLVEAVFHFIEAFSATAILFSVVGMIMYLAPIGAFGAMAFTIRAYGVHTLLSLAKLMATFYLTCILFVFVVLGAIARLHGFSLWRFLRYISEELLIVAWTERNSWRDPRASYR